MSHPRSSSTPWGSTPSGRSCRRGQHPSPSFAEPEESGNRCLDGLDQVPLASFVTQDLASQATAALESSLTDASCPRHHAHAPCDNRPTSSDLTSAVGRSPKLSRNATDALSMAKMEVGALRLSTLHLRSRV
jgi:hypothetical protein